MNRDEWEFEYTADVLLKAATIKKSYHEERNSWWKNKKEGVIGTIKAEGIEFDDSLVQENLGSKFSNSGYNRGTTVQVRNDLLLDLNECKEKIKEHHDKAIGYGSWMQILDTQGVKLLKLHQNDWLYFFGT